FPSRNDEPKIIDAKPKRKEHQRNQNIVSHQGYHCPTNAMSSAKAMFGSQPRAARLVARSASDTTRFRMIVTISDSFAISRTPSGKIFIFCAGAGSARDQQLSKYTQCRRKLQGPPSKRRLKWAVVQV